MQLGLMQPYFFPYVGYFSLIDATQRWVAYDTPQFPREGWVKRNRVLTAGTADWKYVGVPVVRSTLNTPINEVRIDCRGDWKTDLLRSLDYYRQVDAPHYAATVDFLQRAVCGDEGNLSAMLVKTLRATCEYVGIEGRIEVFSELGLDVEPTETAQDRVLAIARKLGGTTYVNLPGGRSLYDPAQFAAHGIELLFVDPTLPPYDQRRQDFVAGLSIIDALMWTSPPEVRAMIRDYRLAT